MPAGLGATPKGSNRIDLAWTAAGGTGGGADFAIVTTQANAPTRSWFVPGPDVTSSRTLSQAAPTAIPSGAPVQLEFFHRYATAATDDGGILEHSLDGGTTWTDILDGQGTIAANPARFLAGGSIGTMDADGAFGARAAWHGRFNSAWVRTVVDLSDFSGRNVTFRFRFGSDTSVSGTGWWIDDIRVFAGSACLATPDAVFANGFEPVAPAP
jgi:hypothetical protein